MSIIREEKFCRKKMTRIYTKEDLVRAVEFFVSNEEDFSMAYVAKLFNIPDQTLSDNIKRKKQQKLGDLTIPSLNHPTSLEMDIIKGISLASQNGWVLSEDIIMEGIRMYCSENPSLMKRFPHSDLQKQWAHNFYMQYKNEITLIEKENLHPLTEDKNCSEHFQKMFFKLLYKKLIMLGIMNNSRKIFVITEFCLETLYNCKNKSYNSLLCCNAAGEFLSPSVIYKDSQSSQCNFEIQGRSLNMTSFTSKCGYLDEKTFELWLKKQFLPFLCESKIRLPVILIIDGHESQMTFNLVQKAEALEVSLMCLPPYSTNELHPFSMGILKSLQLNWLEIRTTFYQRSKLKEISEFTFPLLLRLLYTKLISNRDSVVNGFAACGLCPFNENIMNQNNSSLHKTFLGNKIVNIPKSGGDLKSNIHHEANNKNLCDNKTPATLKSTKSCKKLKKKSHKLKKSTRYFQDSQNVKKIKNIQKRKISHCKKSGKSLKNSSKILQKYRNSPAKAQPKPEEPLQRSEDFQQSLFEFIQVDTKPEQKIFSESEIIVSLDKLGDFSSKYPTLDNFKESLQKLEKIYKLKKCFVPLVNILGKKNISNSESMFPKKRDSLQQSVEDFNKYIVSASCDVIKEELDLLEIQEGTSDDIDMFAIKEEREVEFINIASIKKESDGELFDFPAVAFDDEQKDLKETKILDPNNTSTLEENYELNLFPMFVNDRPEKRPETKTLVNNNHDFGYSVFLNNWNNETRKELQKVRLKLQLNNSSGCEKELRGVLKGKRVKKNNRAKKSRGKRKRKTV